MRRPLVLVALTCLSPVSAACVAACAAPPPSALPGPTTAEPGPATALTTTTLPLASTGIEAGWMDPAADACEDFFAYSCGGFVKTAVIPADRASWGAIQILDKQNQEFLRAVLEKDMKEPAGNPVATKIGDYYAACIDEAAVEKAGIAPIKPLMDVVAGVRDFASLAKAVTELHAEGVFPIFDTSSQQDFVDATLVIGVLDQNGLGLPDRDYYLKDEGNMKDVRAFYAQHVGRMLALAGIPAGERKAATDDVMRIETKLARMQQDKVTRRDPHKIYHRVDRAGLPQAAKTFPWNAYFAKLGIPDIKTISVNDPAYFRGFDALMHDEPATAWRHYLTWQLAHARANVLGKAFVDESFSLKQKLTGQKELAPRWKRCVQGVDRDLGELLGQAYVAAKFGGDSKPRAAAVVDSIFTAMKGDLESLPWMDPPTRDAALKKLSQVHHDKIGYPDKWRVYDFPVTRDAYAADVAAATRFELHRGLDKIGKPLDRTEWGMTPPTVNAYYDPSLDEIVLPAGQLQPPFFSRDFYPPVNIGDTGAGTVGHELTHGFDDEGSQFDGDGNLRDWWSKETKARFDAATKCVQDQYSQYDAVPGVKLNGALTSGENIADIGGVKLGLMALDAWRKAHPEEERSVEGFDDDRLFFLAYAQSWCMKLTPASEELQAHSDPHSPPRWRVNGPMVDTPRFAKAFACKPTAALASAKACTVW